MTINVDLIKQIVLRDGSFLISGYNSNHKLSLLCILLGHPSTLQSQPLNLSTHFLGHGQSSSHNRTPGVHPQQFGIAANYHQPPTGNDFSYYYYIF